MEREIKRKEKKERNKKTRIQSEKIMAKINEKNIYNIINNTILSHVSVLFVYEILPRLILLSYNYLLRIPGKLGRKGDQLINPER